MTSLEIMTDKAVQASEIASKAIAVASRQAGLPDLHESMVGAFYDGYIEACITLLATVSTISPESWSRMIRKAGGQ